MANRSVLCREFNKIKKIKAEFSKKCRYSINKSLISDSDSYSYLSSESK